MQIISFLGVELDSRWVWWRASWTSAPNQCWTSWVPSEAKLRYSWNSFRGSWGIWHPQRSHAARGSFIWDHFSTGCTPESRDGHGAVVHFGWTSQRSVATPSAPGRILLFYGARVPLEQESRHAVVTTDSSSMGWGVICNGQAVSGFWTGPRLLWHINCLELLVVHLALWQFRPLLLDEHVLLRTDNTAAVAYCLNWLHCALSKFRGSSIVQPMRSHDSSRSLENGDSIPQWDCSHCARSGRISSRFLCLHHTGPPGPGFPNSFSSRQPLPGPFFWGRTSFLSGSAPYGTHAQICGTFMCVSWTGRGRLKWSTTGWGRDHHSG